MIEPEVESKEKSQKSNLNAIFYRTNTTFPSWFNLLNLGPNMTLN